MWHPFPGFSGCMFSILAVSLLWVVTRRGKKAPFYNLGPGGQPESYEPILNRYIRLAEYLVGAATGSIVLIVGSSSIHGSGGHLPWFFASPLVLIASSVIFGVCFMAYQIMTFEDVLHTRKHTASNYALSETLGFSSLACFVVGYFWLIISSTNM